MIRCSLSIVFVGKKREVFVCLVMSAVFDSAGWSFVLSPQSSSVKILAKRYVCGLTSSSRVFGFVYFVTSAGLDLPGWFFVLFPKPLLAEGLVEAK